MEECNFETVEQFRDHIRAVVAQRGSKKASAAAMTIDVKTFTSWCKKLYLKWHRHRPMEKLPIDDSNFGPEEA